MTSRHGTFVGWPGGAVAVPAKGPLPVVDLPGGPTLTLLSPGPKQLAALRRTWRASLLPRWV